MDSIGVIGHWLYFVSLLKIIIHMQVYSQIFDLSVIYFKDR